MALKGEKHARDVLWLELSLFAITIMVRAISSPAKKCLTLSRHFTLFLRLPQRMNGSKCIACYCVP
jgi:hypothetical protein